MRNSDPAMALAIPGQSFKDHCHCANVGEPGESETYTYESAEQNPERIDRQRQGGGDQHERSRPHPDLTLQRPARLHTCYDGQASLDPCFCAAFENCDLPLTRFEEIGRHARSRAGLANESDGKSDVEIVEARLDLIQGNVNSGGDVAGGELRARTYVYELVESRWARA